MKTNTQANDAQRRALLSPPGLRQPHEAAALAGRLRLHPFFAQYDAAGLQVSLLPPLFSLLPSPSFSLSPYPPFIFLFAAWPVRPVLRPLLACI